MEFKTSSVLQHKTNKKETETILPASSKQSLGFPKIEVTPGKVG